MESRFVFFSPLMGFFAWPHKIWNRDSTKQRDEERTNDARKIFFKKYRPRTECPVERGEYEYWVYPCGMVWQQQHRALKATNLFPPLDMDFTPEWNNHARQ